MLSVVGHHLGETIHFAVGDFHRASNVLDRSLGRHGPERDDLRYVFPAIFPRHVLDHFAAAAHAEIDVDIRIRNALGIQKALEQ